MKAKLANRLNKDVVKHKFDGKAEQKKKKMIRIREILGEYAINAIKNGTDRHGSKAAIIEYAIFVHLNGLRHL